ncbi:hypothetical protein BCR44DRAFT_348042 [Catenaria anguillulae PL171]|uniref:Postreplication repair E3 ubiquitin-protein ligase RAD18 n=1 Tax=Catenaria anguillulae PL171 TaxID=765915 RepID=A0A1Y2I2S5_9FUNG|nr:hypothetical protein BCR44DRAFT_348042 [Catenaria anguillulae PL171]
MSTHTSTPMDLTHLYGSTPAAHALSSALNAIDDPSDWPSAPAFSGAASQLDTHLRCPMCQELFTSPVLISGCLHTFCSLCIRSRLATSGNNNNTCPTCRRECQERELVANRLVDDVVVAFREARQGLLDATRWFVDQDRTRGRGTSAEAVTNAVGGGQSQSQGLRRSTRARKHVHGSAPIQDGRLVDDQIDDEDDQSEDPRPSKRQRTHSSRDNDGDAPYQIDNDDDDDDIIMVETSSVLSSASSSTSVTTTASATCPICSKSNIHPDLLASHVNACLDSQEHPSSSSPPPTMRPRTTLKSIATPVATPSSSSNNSHTLATARGLIPHAKLPRVVYHHHKDAHLRTLLKDHKLPTTGTRAQLIDRHRTWVRLWNASLDAREERRETVVELRDRVAREERAREVAAAAASVAPDGKGAGSNKTGLAGASVVDALVKAAAGSIGRTVPVVGGSVEEEMCARQASDE